METLTCTLIFPATDRFWSCEIAYLLSKYNIDDNDDDDDDDYDDTPVCRNLLLKWAAIEKNMNNVDISV